MGEGTAVNRVFLVEAGKAALLLRLVACLPVVLAWNARPPPAGHVGVLIVLAVLNTAMILGWRRLAPLIERHPILVGLDVLLSMAALLGPAPPSPFLIYTLCSALLVGLVFRPLAAALLTALLGAAHVLEVRLGGPSGGAALSGLLGTLPLYALLAATGAAFRRMHAQLTAAVHTAYEADRESQRQTAAAAERARLAREMHDSVAKSLLGISMDAAALVRRAPGGSAEAEGARRIAAAARRASQESRRLLADLRGATRATPPLRSTVPDLVVEWGRSVGVEVEAEVMPGMPEPAPPARWALLRCLEEALDNVARHARATRVVVHVDPAPGGADGVRLVVADNGAGFDPGVLGALELAGHFGLAGVRERLAEHGGGIDLDSAPRRGTRVVMTLPLAPP